MHGISAFVGHTVLFVHPRKWYTAMILTAYRKTAHIDTRVKFAGGIWQFKQIACMFNSWGHAYPRVGAARGVRL